jgi:hypothetical protein
MSRTTRPFNPTVRAVHLSEVLTKGASFPAAPAGIVVVYRRPRASMPWIDSVPRSSDVYFAFGPLTTETSSLVIVKQ